MFIIGIVSQFSSYIGLIERSTGGVKMRLRVDILWSAFDRESRQAVQANQEFVKLTKVSIHVS